MMKTALFTTSIVIALSGCSKEEAPPPTPVENKAPTPTPPPAPPPAPAAPTRVEGFSTPESVLYDETADAYLVSNINGDPLGADDNGFISRVAPDGKVELKWIDGAKNEIKLDAPKGMAISGGVLWVADITVVRKFDAKTGEAKGEVAIKGATFLNDVAAGADGGVYVSDSGMTTGFKPSGADAVYWIGADDKVKPIAKAKDLGAPNGLVAPGDGSVWVATFMSGEVYKLSADGKKSDVAKPPKGQLDGLLALEGGDLLVSSWEASAIYRGKPGGEWKEAISGVKSPADFGWDSKRKLLLIPLFTENVVEIRKVE
jgi:sugar lactone lactonase YvrE